MQAVKSCHKVHLQYLDCGRDPSAFQKGYTGPKGRKTSLNRTSRIPPVTNEKFILTTSGTFLKDLCPRREIWLFIKGICPKKACKAIWHSSESTWIRLLEFTTLSCAHKETGRDREREGEREEVYAHWALDTLESWALPGEILMRYDPLLFETAISITESLQITT